MADPAVNHQQFHNKSVVKIVAICLQEVELHQHRGLDARLRNMNWLEVMGSSKLAQVANDVIRGYIVPSEDQGNPRSTRI